MNINSVTDRDLEDLIQSADNEDLSILADFITDQGKGRVALDGAVCKTLSEASKNKTFTQSERSLLAEELRLFGGNAIANLLRGGRGVQYREILCDVADHLKVNYNAKAGVEEIEIGIMTKVLEKSLEDMSEEDKKKLFDELGFTYSGGAGPVTSAALLAAARASGFGVFKLTVIVANAIAKAILGRGIPVVVMAPWLRGLSILIGPVGWALTALWTVFDLAAPAYRVTIPCVVQLAYMRQKAAVKTCKKCNAPMALDAKFCGECGHATE
jgi:uncharacterized protein YaaW (UPF0174 family)